MLARSCSLITRSRRTHGWGRDGGYIVVKDVDDRVGERCPKVRHHLSDGDGLVVARQQDSDALARRVDWARGHGPSWGARREGAGWTITLRAGRALSSPVLAAVPRASLGLRHDHGTPLHRRCQYARVRHQIGLWGRSHGGRRGAARRRTSLGRWSARQARGRARTPEGPPPQRAPRDSGPSGSSSTFTKRAPSERAGFERARRQSSHVPTEQGDPDRSCSAFAHRSRASHHGA